jgi:hypothetical protein
MAWQDELRNLDEALAQGRISGDQHRVERDRILASAADAMPGGGQRWQAMNPAPTGAPSDADRTQVVRGGGDPNATAYVQAPRFPPQQQQMQPPPNQQQQFAPQQPVSPPWSDQPGSGFTSTGDWAHTRQGPEVFEDTGKGDAGKWVAVAIIVLLLGGAATWWFGFREDSGSTAQETTTSSTPTTQAKPVVMTDLPDPSGQPNGNTGEYTPEEAKTKKVIGDADFAAVKTSGTAKLFYKAAIDQGIGYSVSAFPAKDGGAANELSDALVAQHTNIGMAPFEIAGVPKGVSVMKVQMPQPKQILIRAVYIAGNTVVRVGVLATPSVTEQQAVDGFTKYLKKVLESVPAQ